DEASPMVDARLADGSRVNIVLPPIVLNGGTISIRKFPKRAMTLDAIMRLDSLSQEIARLLQIAARSRLNILISGGTGTGKTTLLNAISQHIDRDERVITIEDAVELRLQQPHVVQMETRPPNIEGAGHIPQRELVRNALRMRPGIRRVQNIAEIAGMEGEIITMRELYAFQFHGERRDGTIEGEFQSTRMRPDFVNRAARFGLDRELLDAIGIAGARV